MRRRYADKTILLVEETRFFRETVEEALLRAGFRVRTAASAPQGRQLLEAEGHRVDLLVLDLHLSPVDGFDLLEHLRHLKPPQHPPILVMLLGLEIEEAIQQLQGLEAVGVQDKRAASAQIAYRVGALVNPRGGKERATVRVPLGVPVNYAVGRWQSQGIVFNLSKTGIFLSTDLPVEAGHRLTLQFILSGIPRLFQLSGVIVWTASSPGGLTPSGMGVKFLDVDAATAAQLAAFVKLEVQRLGPPPISRSASP
ncbi:MAG: PilZ domain-containing protein [candidate division NC10 bacterium]|nr:PilZ domain-containing protein [candidate division NC10 bacterium]